LGVFAALALTSSAPASSARTRTIDLTKAADVTVVGAGEDAAIHVSPAGDVNADGIPDIVVASGFTASENSQGRTYVIFGARPMPEEIDVSDPWVGGGFVIEGAEEDDSAYLATGAGDVNGDGHDDVVVGAGGADNNLRFNSGTAYVVFGKATTEPVSLAAFNANAQGTAGFRIDGPYELSLAGGSGVAGPGDMSGDGLAEVVVTAPFIGRTYVVFGKTDSMPVDLRDYEDDSDSGGFLSGYDAGFRIEQPRARSAFLNSVGAGGDVNGDGTPDVVVGAMGNRYQRTCACVVFGKADTRPVRLKRPGNWGFRIHGDNISWSTAGAGDVNGDGLDDIVAGAPASGHCCGRAFVVFGKKGQRTVRIGVLGGKRRGYRIVGYEDGANVGTSVYGAGDVNGDGREDVVVGGSGANAVADTSTGSAWVVFGKKGSRTVRLSSLGERGYRLNGGRREAAGASVAGLGDLNGDDIPDMIIGTSASRAYVVWGFR
jgi:hypothetical protein